MKSVALRKESVDRNLAVWAVEHAYQVALRKESVDRNTLWEVLNLDRWLVALRKESVDRNLTWHCIREDVSVALRKESVDRNCELPSKAGEFLMSLSARRAWIEICGGACGRLLALSSLSARRAWIEICIMGMI